MMRSAIGLLILVLAAVVTTLGVDRVRKTLRADLRASERAPQLVGMTVEAVRFDAQGRRKYVVTTPQAVHHQGDAGTEFSSPQLTVYPESGEAPWTGHAEEGWVTADASVLHLAGEVILNFPEQGPEGGDAQIRTDYLRFRPANNIADTDRPITVESPAYRVDAVGSRVDLELKTVELTSRVRGSHEAP